MNTAQIIDPTREVTLKDGQKVKVRELPWPDALKLLQMLGKQAEGITQLLAGDAELAAAAATGNRTLVTERLVKHLNPVVIGTTEIADFLLQRAVVEPAVFDTDRLGVGDALRVLRAALELTINDELVAEGNAIAGVLKRAFTTAQQPTPGSPVSGSSPTSSGRDIPRPWSAPTPSASSTSTPASSANG